MVRYLLSVHSSDAGQTPSPEVMERRCTQVDRFNQEVQAAGSGPGSIRHRPATLARLKARRPIRADG